jgi:hypothetical protein
MTDRGSVIEALEQAIPFMRVKGYGAVALIMLDALELLKLEEPPDVVRCKDCKYWHNSHVCPLYSDWMGTGGNWFCADGERKENK